MKLKEKDKVNKLDGTGDAKKTKRKPQMRSFAISSCSFFEEIKQELGLEPQDTCSLNNIDNDQADDEMIPSYCSVRYPDGNPKYMTYEEALKDHDDFVKSESDEGKIPFSEKTYYNCSWRPSKGLIKDVEEILFHSCKYIPHTEKADQSPDGETLVHKEKKSESSEKYSKKFITDMEKVHGEMLNEKAVNENSDDQYQYHDASASDENLGESNESDSDYSDSEDDTYVSSESDTESLSHGISNLEIEDDAYNIYVDDRENGYRYHYYDEYVDKMERTDQWASSLCNSETCGDYQYFSENNSEYDEEFDYNTQNRHSNSAYWQGYSDAYHYMRGYYDGCHQIHTQWMQYYSQVYGGPMSQMFQNQQKYIYEMSKHYSDGASRPT